MNCPARARTQPMCLNFPAQLMADDLKPSTALQVLQVVPTMSGGPSQPAGLEERAVGVKVRAHNV